MEGKLANVKKVVKYLGDAYCSTLVSNDTLLKNFETLKDGEMTQLKTSHEDEMTQLKTAHSKELEDKVDEAKTEKETEIKTLTDDSSHLSERLNNLSNTFFLQFAANKKSEVDRLNWLEYDCLANLTLTTNDFYNRFDSLYDTYTQR